MKIPFASSAARRARRASHAGVALRGVAASLLLAGAVSHAFAAPAGKTLVYCTEGSPAGFDPGQHMTSTDFDASTYTVYNGLVQFKRGTLDLVPSLATRWDVSADQRVYTFHLRHDGQFSTTAAAASTGDHCAPFTNASTTRCTMSGCARSKSSSTSRWVWRVNCGPSFCDS